MNEPQSTSRELTRAELNGVLPDTEARAESFAGEAIPADLVDASAQPSERLSGLGAAYLTSVLPSGSDEAITAFARRCAECGLTSEHLSTLLVELQTRLLREADQKAAPVSQIQRSTARDIAGIATAHARIEARADGIEDTTETLSEIHGKTEEVTERSTEIESLTEQQARNMEKLSQEVGDISAAVEEIAASTDEVSDQSDNAADLAEEGYTKARALRERIDEIHTRATRVAEAIEALSAHVDDIDRFVDTIDEIADQTDMLAINASIEAARVDGGEGFAVVAEEVKSLAEDSQKEAAQIRDLVTTITDATETVAEDIQGVSEQTEAGRREVSKSVDTFEEIEEVTGRLSASMDEIATATGQQAESTEELAMMTDEATRKSEMILTEANGIKSHNQELLRKLENTLGSTGE
ncbi:methyl-accepting chemotaxis protein [Halobellus ordinarius]|uniref:methyl-accepting chemotaxis protein n=1 Tax=Halobellus ordinarius TaxID=3075120 RepID=UPI0028800E3A|nr:methyl-accepting chemotaxis protein [Halobellus sp. ZY16]